MLEIRPRERVGELAFGTARADARAVLGSAGEVFRRAPHELTASESYPGAGLVLGFDLEDRLRTVEMTARAEPVLRGVRLFGRPLDDVLAELRRVGVTPEKGPAGWAVRGARSRASSAGPTARPARRPRRAAPRPARA